MTLNLRYAAKSDIGMVRKANEDSGFAGRTLLAVADGMGGHAAGELASSTAIATLAELDSEDLPTESLLTALDDAIVTSAERIGQFIDADQARAGMGTTVTAILWRAGRIAVIHVGDSRAYMLRDGELTQITHDHTYVQSLIDAGRITPEQARRHPKRNLLLRAIDGSQVPEGETSMREALAGDRYLLCSDGLCGVVEDADILETLREYADPTAAVTRLVDLALEAGAPDNVTAVVADVVDVPDAELAVEVGLASPVVVGAAGEPRNRAALPGLQFPDDVSGGDPTSSLGPEVAGGLVARSGGRSVPDPGESPDADGTGVHPGLAPEPAAGTIGEAIESGELPVGTLAPDEAVESAVPDEHGEPEPEVGYVRRHLKAFVTLIVILAGLLVALIGFIWWLSSQWYVGQAAGYVTISQGVPQDFLGIPLHRVTTTTAIPLDGLPQYDQGQVLLTIDAGTEAQAFRIVSGLEAKAAACAGDSPPLGCPVPGPTSTATPSPSASPGAAASAP
jgi:PPM family protein phosphatase